MTSPSCDFVHWLSWYPQYFYATAASVGGRLHGFLVCWALLSFVITPKNVTLTFGRLVSEDGFAWFLSAAFERLCWLLFFTKNLSANVPHGRAKWRLLWPL
jgi:hypothetical protein